MANDMINMPSAVSTSGVSGDMSGRKAAQPLSTAAPSVSDVSASESSSTVTASAAKVNEDKSPTRDETADKKEAQRQQLEKQAQDLQEMSNSKGWSVSFKVDSTSQQTIIKVVDNDTHKTIRQIPSEEMVRLQQRIEAMREDTNGDGSLQGLLLDRQA